MLRSPVLLAALADAAAPGIRPVKVEGLRVPAGSVYQTALITGFDGKTWVVRSALTGAAGAELAASDALVQLLANRVSFDLPRVAGSARPRTGPAVAVYPRLRGKELDWSALEEGSPQARALGLALAQLHSVDPRVVEEAGLPSYDAQTYRARLESDLERAEATRLVPKALLTRWRAALEADALWRFSTTVTHGPLDGKDVLVEGDEVSAMNNWEHAGVSDPARDFATLWSQASLGAFDTVFESYAAARDEQPDAHLERRIRLMGELELVYALLASRTMGDEALVDYYVDALEELSEDAEGDDSLLPPARRGGIAPIDLNAFDPEDMEPVDVDMRSEATIVIPITEADERA